MAALAWRDIAAEVARDPDAFIDERDRRRLLAFTRRMFPKYREAPHHALIAEYLEAVARDDLDRLVAILPPRFGKSTLCSEHFPAWLIGNRPDSRVIGCSHTAQLAYHFSHRVRGLVENPLWPFPDVRIAKDEGAKSVWGIDGRRGGYVAAGVGGAITGFGANVLLVDDAVKSAAEADSETLRDNAWEWFTGTALTRLEPHGSVVVVGTRWHEADLIGRVLNGTDSARWTVLHVPALSDDEVVYADVTLPLALATRLGLVEGDVLPLADGRSRLRGR